MKKLLLIFIFVLLASSAFGADYYVTNGVGSSGTGTSASPWKAWSDINWTTVNTALASGSVTIYLDSRSTWTGAGAITITRSNSSTNLLTISGMDYYYSGGSWIAESGSSIAHFDDPTGIYMGGSNIHFITVRGIYLHSPTYSIYLSDGETVPYNNVHDITIEYCTVDNPDNQHGIYGGNLESGCYNLIFRGNTIIDPLSECIYVGHYNYLSDTITGVIVENNTCISGSGGEVDIDIKPGCYGAIVRYNTHYQGGAGKGCGVVIQANACEVYGNTFYTMGSDGDWGNGIAVHAEGDAEGHPKTITSLSIYNNLIYSNDNEGISIWTTYGANISGVNIYNNTIVNNGGNAQITAWTSGSGTITIANLKNNILSGSNYAISASGNVTITESDYNIIYRTSGNPIYYGGAARTWEAWQALGFDAHGYNVNPSLSVEYKSDSPSDPAVDKGVALNGTFTIDHDQATRGATWDIGAYEYGAGTTPPSATGCIIKSTSGNKIRTGGGGVQLRLQ